MIERKDYLDMLWAWKDEPVIKVISGIRRCGKSVLLKQYQERLKAHGVPNDQIIALNFEDLAYESLQDYRALYQEIMNRLQPGKKTYIFLDEIQKVSSFEKVVDSLYIQENIDLYITGSNAYLLSGELATLLSGRYVEVSILPLSFREYWQMQDQPDAEKCLTEYMRTGAFPYVAALKGDESRIDTYLEGIYNTIIIKDIEERQRRRQPSANSRKITDLALLQNISRFLAGTIGSPVSVRNIANYITSSGRRVSPNTIDEYLTGLTEPFIFYPAARYDLPGKQVLKTMPKYYLADLGIRHYLLPRETYDLGFSLENIVFLELKRRGYEITIGKIGTAEIDFVTRRLGLLYYFQVTASMIDPHTFESEISPLRKINDNYEKVILTLDHFTPGNYDGIKVINIIDWLLNEKD